MIALDAGLHRRAGARCAAAEPHRHPGEDWPCRRCIDAVQVQIAIAAQLSAPALGGATGPAAGAPSNGVPGRAPWSPAATGQDWDFTLQTDNQPRAENPRLAEGATAIARNESMP